MTFKAENYNLDFQIPTVQNILSSQYNLINVLNHQDVKEWYNSYIGRATEYGKKIY